MMGQTPYQRRKARKAEALARWEDENREMIDALGGDMHARRIVQVLARAGVNNLADLRSARAGTFDYFRAPHWYIIDKGDPVEKIRGIGVLAMSRIKEAIDDQ